MKLHSLYLLLFSLIIISCNKCKEEVKPVLVEKPEMINEEVNVLLKDNLINQDTSDYILVCNDTLYATKQLIEFYELNGFQATWTDKGKFRYFGDTLFSIIKNADIYGLSPIDYHYYKIDSLVKTYRDTASKKYDAAKLYQADVLMTDAFFTFIVHVSKGRLNPDSLTREWHPEKLDTNLVQLLVNGLTTNCIRETIDSLEPQHKEYRQLKKALSDFKLEFSDVDWDSIDTRESDSVTFMQRVKERLIKSHDYFEEYDGSDSIKLVKAIKNFQCKHYLNEDGKVGKLTFKAMQMTKQDYINQIALNMERWRLQNPPKEKKYIWVNIPKYEMKVVEEDTLVMESKVIVGAVKTPTPLLKSKIGFMTIYPYWNVPYSIATKEILPRIKWDTTYLRKKNFEVIDWRGKVVDPKKIKWKKYNKDNLPYRFRQRIGEDNSLGVLKFNFHNKYGVYMHDTDARKLFNRENRAMSHGCVRLDKYMDLAQFLIRDDSLKYPKDSLLFDIFKEEQKQVYIKKPVVIYISYFTCEIDKHGGLYFYIDVYGRDKKMFAALNRS